MSKNSVKNLFSHRLFLPLLLFAGLIALFSYSTYYMDKPPVIEDVSPDVAYPGELVEITGRNFGAERNGHEVIFAGIRPVINSYISWSDTSVVLKVPEKVTSGLVTVSTDVGTSNGVLFTNKNLIPQVVEGPAKPGFPYIERIEPDKVAVGDLVIIYGKNFGRDRGPDTDVLFTGITGQDTAGFITPKDQDYVYELWTDQEIHLRVPDGALPGRMSVNTPRGESNALFLEVVNPAGDKVYTEKRGYHINYTIEISDIQASGNNTVDIWVTRASESPSQHIIELVSSPVPLWENYLGATRFRLENLEPFRSYTLEQEVWLERFKTESRVYTGRVATAYEEDSKLFKTYTEATAHIPAKNPAVQSVAASLAGRDRNPYRISQYVYDYLVKRYTFSNESTEFDGFLDSRSGDSWNFVTLFCALLRNRGIPARPVSGFLITDAGSTVKHFWAELYLPGFGWLPVDPVLGSGADIEGFRVEQDAASFYFGNLDNRRIAFSHGIIPVSPQYPDGKTVQQENSWALQTVHEEVTGDLDSYNSRWNPVRVKEVW